MRPSADQTGVYYVLAGLLTTRGGVTWQLVVVLVVGELVAPLFLLR